jgi:hypothetical protein
MNPVVVIRAVFDARINSPTIQTEQSPEIGLYINGHFICDEVPWQDCDV